jgi:hypothetical protein
MRIKTQNTLSGISAEVAVREIFKSKIDENFDRETLLNKLPLSRLLAVKKHFDLKFNTITVRHILDMGYGLDLVIRDKEELIGIDVTTNPDSLREKQTKLKRFEKVFRTLGITQSLVLVWDVQRTFLTDSEMEFLLLFMSEAKQSQQQIVRLSSVVKDGKIAVKTDDGILFINDYTGHRYYELTCVGYQGQDTRYRNHLTFSSNPDVIRINEIF